MVLLMHASVLLLSIIIIHLKQQQFYPGSSVER